MEKLKKSLFALAGVLTLGLLAAPITARAESFSFTGAFTQNDNVRLFSFSLNTASLVTIRTWSYAGGVNAQGETIARGGFDPYLALFDDTGAFVDENDDSDLELDPVTGEGLDSFLLLDLNAGNYFVSLTQSDNFSVGDLSDGFFRSGQGNFAGGFPDLNDRNGRWALDIENVDAAAPVPEPATMLLLGTGLAGVGAAIRRRRAV